MRRAQPCSTGKFAACTRQGHGEPGAADGVRHVVGIQSIESQLIQAIQEMTAYFAGHIEARKQHPTDDLISTLMQTKDKNGQPLEDAHARLAQPDDDGRLEWAGTGQFRRGRGEHIRSAPGFWFGLWLRSLLDFLFAFIFVSHASKHDTKRGPRAKKKRGLQWT